MISVIMPVYNSEKYVGRAIQSILDQTYKDIELILIDDGSTDASASIMQLYAEKDQRIRIISQKNLGVSSARNRGIVAARGEWLYFMDSDDYVDSVYFQAIIPWCDLYDVIITGANRHYEDGKKRDRVVLPICLEVLDKKGYSDFLGKVVEDCSQDLIFNYMWNKIIRSSVILEKDIRFTENLSLGEDFFFNCDLFENSIRIKTINKAYCHYNIHEDTSLVGRFYRHELERRSLVFHRTTELYEHYSVYNQYKNELEIREGRYSYKSLSKIKNKSCNLSYQEKIQYIDEFLKARKEFIAKYLAKEGGIRNIIKRMIILSGNARLVGLMFFRLSRNAA